MAGNPGAADRLLALFAKRADADGVFTVDTAGTAEVMGCTGSNVRALTSRLFQAGAIARVDIGRYRITGKPYVAAKPQPKFHPIVREARTSEDVPTAPSWRGGVECSYRTARALGIDPALRFVPDRNATPGTARSSTPSLIAITLARVPSLERPLPT